MQLRAEGQWSVESKPDWCMLSQTSGSGDTNLTLTITALPHGDGDREGDVIFRLDDKEYNCTFHVTQKDYAHPCDEWITLQQATKGQNGGINIVLLGDGYDLDRITDGSYLEDMKTVSKWFFDIEPYKSYRQYFNVYTAIALSQGNGIGTPNTPIATRFGTTYNGTSGLTANTDEIFRYALGAPTVDAGNLCRTLIIVVPNRGCDADVVRRFGHLNLSAQREALSLRRARCHPARSRRARIRQTGRRRHLPQHLHHSMQLPVLPACR